MCMQSIQMSCWTRCICSESVPSPHAERVTRILDYSYEDADNILALLSDPTFLQNDIHLALALLVYPGLLSRLVDYPDKHVQFMVFGILKRVLLDTHSTDSLTSARLNCPHRSDLIRVLVQNLENSSTTIPQCRATLELVHDVLKHRRQMVRRHNDNAGRQTVQTLGTETPGLLSASTLLIQQLAWSPRLWIKLTERMVEFPELQRPTIVVMIDLFKSLHSSLRPSGAFFDGSYDSAAGVCRDRVLGCLEQLLRVDMFDAIVHRKLLELLTLIVKSRSRTTQQPTASTSLSCNNHLFQDLHIILPIVETLSSIAQKVLETLYFTDPFLERLSVPRTTFISIKDTEQSPHTIVQSCLSNPEVLGQLGRIFVEAALATLESLSVEWKTPLGSIFLKSTENGDTSAILDRVEVVRNVIRDWVGPQTLSVLLSLYGQDDAGVSWLLKSLTILHQRLRNVSQRVRSTIMMEMAAGSVQGNRLWEASSAPHPEQGPSWSPTLVYAQQDQQSQSDHKHLLRLENLVSSIYGHLACHAHPIEAFISFLETIGYDADTLLDLLLTVDDRETGGMLGAIMAVLRDFTEDTQTREGVFARWIRGIDQEDSHGEQEESDNVEKERGYLIVHATAGGSGSGARRRLFDSEYCLVQVADQIARLNEKNLFPYNPAPLLVVLGRTMQALQTVIGSAEP